MAQASQPIQLQISIKPMHLVVGVFALIATMMAIVSVMTASIVNAQNTANVDQSNTATQPQIVYACDHGANGSGSGHHGSSAKKAHKHTHPAPVTQSNSSVITQTDSHDVTNVTETTTINRRFVVRDSFNVASNNVVDSFNPRNNNNTTTEVDIEDSFNIDSPQIEVEDSFNDESIDIDIRESFNSDLTNSLNDDSLVVDVDL